jgi:hypothetical protein
MSDRAIAMRARAPAMETKLLSELDSMRLGAPRRAEQPVVREGDGD